VSQNAWNKTQEEQLAAECQAKVEAAVERYLATPPRPPASMFDHLYATLPDVYAAQRREIQEASDG
jgi:pyruvate dehydrogenase E1 component alpha subunit